MARRDLPEAVQELFFDFHWDRELLWREAAAFALETVPIDSLRAHLELPVWPRFEGQKTFDLRPSEFLAEPARYPHHLEQMRRADLSYPLLMMRNARSSWVLLDGYHRLARRILEGATEVEVRRLDRSIIPKIRVGV
ncbi:MAG TPA: hypothetical protein VM598_00960 [Bdellovibrionota bacterium]|nr:hypothetical protein [Bdellovibrionota bacterium]